MSHIFLFYSMENEIVSMTSQMFEVTMLGVLPFTERHMPCNCYYIHIDATQNFFIKLTLLLGSYLSNA